MSDKADFRPIICVDFDGVIHSYEHGWRDGSIYGSAVPGFFEWLMGACRTCDVVIYSSRCKTSDGVMAIKDAMDRWSHDWRAAYRGLPGDLIYTVSAEKPPAFMTIDDRAICFRGDWSAPELEPAAIRAFKPWNVA